MPSVAYDGTAAQVQVQMRGVRTTQDSKAFTPYGPPDTLNRKQTDGARSLDELSRPAGGSPGSAQEYQRVNTDMALVRLEAVQDQSPSRLQPMLTQFSRLKRSDAFALQAKSTPLDPEHLAEPDSAVLNVATSLPVLQ